MSTASEMTIPQFSYCTIRKDCYITWQITAVYRSMYMHYVDPKVNVRCLFNRSFSITHCFPVLKGRDNTCVCVQMWRSEVDTGYLPQSCFLFCYFKTRSLTECSPQPTPRDLPVSVTTTIIPGGGATDVYLPLMWVMGIKPQSNPLSHLSSPSTFW